MANGVAGRPRAEDLAVRCVGKNARGVRCGLPPLDGGKVCAHHLGSAGQKAQASMAERLRAGADEALARLRQVVAGGADPDAVRAAEILLSRVAPKLSSNRALVVTVDGGPTDNLSASPAEIIRKRLEALAISSAPEEQEPENLYSAEALAAEDAAWATAPQEDDVIDAELVAEPVRPEPVVSAPEPEYAVPRHTTRPADLRRIQAHRQPWSM